MINRKLLEDMCSSDDYNISNKVGRQCPHCKRAGLTRGMFSEDFTSVFDQSCKFCNTRFYEAIGEHAPQSRWDDFEIKYPLMLKEEAC